MFCSGLELCPSDFTSFRLTSKPLWIGLVGQLILLPLVAWLSVQMFDLPPLFAAGVILIACCPGGSSSNAFTMLAKGNVALSVILTAITSVVSVITIPFFMSLLSGNLGEIELPIGKLLIQNVVLMIVPLALGMIWRDVRPKTALVLAHWIKRYALFMLLTLVIVFFIENRLIIIVHFAEVSLVTAVLLIGAMTLGGLLSQIFSLDTKDRKAILIEIGMQNAAQAIAVASSPFVFNSKEMAVPAVIYALLMNIVLLLYVQYARFKVQ